MCNVLKNTHVITVVKATERVENKVAKTDLL
jgi:hypothetical protein